MERIHFRVSGRVQGVGFRAYVQYCASRRRLSGWVRNCWDGTVEGEAEGPSEALLELQAELRQGPGMSFVERLVIEHSPAMNESGPFRIRRDG